MQSEKIKEQDIAKCYEILLFQFSNDQTIYQKLRESICHPTFRNI